MDRDRHRERERACNVCRIELAVENVRFCMGVDRDTCYKIKVNKLDAARC